TVGGSNWCYTGDSITWKFIAPKDGWYSIYMRQRQNVNQGLNSYRTLMIDGETPFKEAENLCFEYEMKWRVKALGEEKPYQFYLSAGEHTLTLACSAGPMAEPLRELNQAILDLNSVYRKIITVTGTSPDVYKDYNLDTTVEGLIPGLNNLSERLIGIADKIESIVGTRQSQVSVLDEMADMLSSMAKTPYTIPTRLTNYKSKVESIGSLLLSMTQQPLTIDYIELVPEKGTASSGKTGFFEKLTFSAATLASSFTEDYSVLNTVEEGKTPVETWVSSGRDQVKIISQIVNDFFVTKTGIPVKLSIVDTSTTLVEATLAGKGPDVALLVPQDTPVNLASRDALVDLSKFNLGELKNEIYEQSFNPFRYNGGLYALPESETFNMLFYRTDVFEQLGLSVPETWDEFYEVMNVLRFNNLEVGIPEVNTLNRGVSLAINFFETLLYQNGVSLFNENLTATALDTETAYSMFERCTELYTDYGLDQEFNFFNRFRAGEMAMAIEAYSAYNQITAAAPELNGLWSFAPIPGTVGEDGKLNRSAVGTVTGCIMLKSAEKKGIENDAWEFISWWVNGDTQGYYANMLESVMGVLGRYTPANHEAFSQMRWTSDEAALIDEQWESVVLMPEIPGGYYVNRSLTSAIRSAISQHSSPRRELALYNRDINNEITRKRKEFGLSYEGEEK
ncbi:MAG: extracellular solute-binding protein, partial [Clostridia bacterium]|nr:extracellular solute-binding protein [Clostridia bacterium]